MGLVLGGSGEPVSAVYAENQEQNKETISYVPAVPNQEQFGSTRNIGQSLETFLAVIIGVCCWHPVGRGHGCC